MYIEHQSWFQHWSSVLAQLQHGNWSLGPQLCFGHITYWVDKSLISILYLLIRNWSSIKIFLGRRNKQKRWNKKNALWPIHVFEHGMNKVVGHYYTLRTSYSKTLVETKLLDLTWLLDWLVLHLWAKKYHYILQQLANLTVAYDEVESTKSKKFIDLIHRKKERWPLLTFLNKASFPITPYLMFTKHKV
jgi:hypothetical protein